MYYLRLLWLFIRSSIQQEMAFRVNFSIKLLNAILRLVTGLVGLRILFSHVEEIRGWSFAQTLTLLGVYLLVTALYSIVIEPSMESIGGISGDVWTGRFDYTLLKPVQTQFLVSFQRWSLWSMIDLLLSMIVLGAGIRQLSAQLTQAAIGTFVLNLMVSMIILYSLSLLLTSATFWFQGIPLLGAFISFFQLSRYPVGIYPGWLKLVLTWVLPVGFVTTVPVEMLTRQASVYILVLGGLLA